MFLHLPHCEMFGTTTHSNSRSVAIWRLDRFLRFSFQSCCAVLLPYSFWLSPLSINSGCGNTWPGPSTTRTRPRPPTRSSSWRKFRGSPPANARPSVRSGSPPCSSRTPSLESGITDMPSEWLKLKIKLQAPVTCEFHCKVNYDSVEFNNTYYILLINTSSGTRDKG